MIDSAFDIKNLTLKPFLAKISGDYFTDLAKLRLLIKASDDIEKAVIMCGGGNIMRGKNEQVVQRNYSDIIGMLSTSINGLSLLSILEELGVEAKIFSPIPSLGISKYCVNGCIDAIDSGIVVILTSGIGCGYVSTDTALVIRALELDCIPIKITVVGGIFSKDPKQDMYATMHKNLSYDDAVKKGGFDKSGIMIAKDNQLPVLVTDFSGYMSILSGKIEAAQYTLIS